ncbi:MAG: hypothetical protein WD314_12940 [Trueperaceae bacterium]
METPPDDRSNVLADSAGVPGSSLTAQAVDTVSVDSAGAGYNGNWGDG